MVFSFWGYEKPVFYDVVSKIFMKFNSSPTLGKGAFLEAKSIDKTKFADVLATVILISVPASLAFPSDFLVKSC